MAMDSKKVVIIVAVVVVLLYFVSLGVGFAPKERDNTTKDSYIADSKKSGGGGGWESALGRLMAPFAPRLPVTQLLDVNRSGCETVTFQSRRVILLTSSKPQCRLVIAPFKEDDFRKGRLTLLEPRDVSLQVAFESNDRDVEAGESRLDAKEPLDVSVMASGGTLTLKCSNCDRPVRVRFE